MDFAELLLRCHELLRDNDALLTHYRRRFGQLLVDEFQDTNTIQYAWLRLLAGDTGNVMAVGDDDQSIYGWRGAKIENIQRFSDDFEDTEIIRLEQNYRSTSKILDAANGLIGNNLGRLGKSLWTSAGDGDPVKVYAAFNEVEEARFVADRTREWLRDGAPDEVAVLYRSNAQSRVLEEAFLMADIPYRIYGGLRFFERAEVKNALGYMRLMNQRHADVAFERVVNTPPRGIGERTIDSVRGLARANETSLWQAAKDGIASGELGGRMATVLRNFIEEIDTMSEALQHAELDEVARHCIDASGLMEYHGKEPGERGLARKENLEELVTACRQFRAVRTFPVDPRGEADEEESDLDQFLDHAALEAGEYQTGGGAAVQMMTLHSAKGLEFPLVFLTGLEEGLFPHRRSADEPGRMEEERRLAYVGVTRAMRQLYLTYAQVRRFFGTESINRPSRFLLEIPTDTLEEVRMGGAVSRPVRRVGAGSKLEDSSAALRGGSARAPRQVRRGHCAAERRKRRARTDSGEFQGGRIEMVNVGSREVGDIGLNRAPGLRALGLAAALAVLLGACAPEESQDTATPAAPEPSTFEWKLVTTWPKNLPGLGTAPERLAEMVDVMSAGRLKDQGLCRQRTRPGVRGVRRCIRRQRRNGPRRRLLLARQGADRGDFRDGALRPDRPGDERMAVSRRGP